MNAFLWSALNKVSTQVINFIVFVILARLLSVEDFGLMALVSVYISILTVLIEQGVSVVIIQRENLTDAAVNTAFTVSIIFSSILFVLGLCFTENIANLFDKPELKVLIFTSNFVLLFGSLYTISSALVRKKLDFRTLAISATISALVGGGVAIILALNGFGVWSLLVKFFLETILLTFLLYRSIAWHPRLYFSRSHFKDIFYSSSFIFGINSLKLMSRKMVDFLIAYYFGVSQLGYFDVASRLYNSLNSILSQIIASVSLPLFSEIQSDQKLSKKVYNTLFRYSILIPVPIYILCIILAHPIILFFFGSKWETTIYISQVLCIAGILQQFQSINESLLFARNKMQIKFFQELIKVSIIGIMFFAFYRRGLNAIPWVIVIGAAFSYIYDVLVTSRILKASIIKLLYNNIRIIVVVVMSSILTYSLMINFPPNSNILYIIFGGLLFYSLFVLMLLFFDKEFKKQFYSILFLVKRKLNEKA